MPDRSMDETRDELAWERDLSVGDRVLCRWGYGLGFRARGVARVVKINRKSIRVALEADVASPHGDGRVGWEAGQELRVPNRIGHDWHPDHGLFPLPDEDATPEVAREDLVPQPWRVHFAATLRSTGEPVRRAFIVQARDSHEAQDLVEGELGREVLSLLALKSWTVEPLGTLAVIEIVP